MNGISNLARRGAAVTLLFAGIAFGAVEGKRAGEPGIDDPAREFYRAREAYDAGRMDEAAGIYGTMISNGFDGVSVLFNLGNVEFRRGHIPEAVYWYRRAWSVSPRDPDVKANLYFAWKMAGAPPPVEPIWIRAGERLSRREWGMLLHAGLAGSLLLFGLGGLFFGRRHVFWRAIAIPALLILAGASGLAIHGLRAEKPEMVAVKTTDALFAPIQGSTTHFEVPAGTIVRRTESQGPWIRVDLNGREGWLSAADAKLLP